MFIDEIKLNLKAGRGGSGVVRWLHLKAKEFAGPAGGDGGAGGSVYVRAIRDISALAQYRNKKNFSAENGKDGQSRSKEGKNGEDLILDVPVGSVVTNRKTGKKFELLKEGETVPLLRGGRGGLGNEYFKSSTNIRPRESTPGKSGEEADFLVELELIADAGLIGLPNAGKSSLLNALTRAAAKVASYPFTTLNPSLGDFYGFILADIPGLIEGASEGKGLGHKFLRHIKRTRMILHCVSLEHEDVESPYLSVRKELVAFDPGLAGKEEIIILTKTDLVDAARAGDAAKKLSKHCRKIIPTSVLNDAQMKNLSDILAATLRGGAKPVSRNCSQNSY